VTKEFGENRGTAKALDARDLLAVFWGRETWLVIYMLNL